MIWALVCCWINFHASAFVQTTDLVMCICRILWPSACSYLSPPWWLGKSYIQAIYTGPRSCQENQRTRYFFLIFEGKIQCSWWICRGGVADCLRLLVADIYGRRNLIVKLLWMNQRLMSFVNRIKMAACWCTRSTFGSDQVNLQLQGYSWYDGRFY